MTQYTIQYTVCSLYILLLLSLIIYLFLQRREPYKVQDEEQTIEHFSTTELWDFIKVLLILFVIFLYVYEKHGAYGIYKVVKEVVQFLLYIGRKLLELGGKLIGMTKKTQQTKQVKPQPKPQPKQVGKLQRIKQFSTEKWTNLKTRLPNISRFKSTNSSISSLKSK